MQTRVSARSRWRSRGAWLLALALFQACGGDASRSTGPTATTSVDIPVVFRRAAPQIPAGCQGVLTAVGPGPTQTVPLPPLEVMLSLTAGIWTLTVTITCGTETATGQATVTVVPPTPIQVNIQVGTAGTLTVNRNGEGTVTGPGINCGGDCSERYTIGTVVTLSATPAAGSTFTGWSGGGCGGTGQCQVTITTAPISVTANFAGPLGLTVAIAGTGSGTVTSSPSGIACPPACSAQFAPGTDVTLTATPGAGSTFVGWSGGGCSGTGPCRIRITTDPIAVTATFAGPLGLTVAIAGTGSGTVTSNPPGIACPTTCSAPFTSGTVVTLTAAPGAGSTFAGWSGGGCSGTGPCAVTVSGSVVVTATFTGPPATATLNIAKAGTAAGSGTVSSNPPGINCGGSCSAQFTVGTPVTLNFTESPGTFFTGWSGGGCPASRTACNLVLTANTNITANFEVGGTIDIFNNGLENMNNVTINGPFVMNPGSFTAASGEITTFTPVPPGNYSIPAGQYYPPGTTGACPAVNFSVAPGLTTTVTYTQQDNSPLLDCPPPTVGGGPLRRRR
jgi:hypothetical protein